MMAKENYRFALCVEKKDCEDLEKRKIYQIIPHGSILKGSKVPLHQSPLSSEPPL
jgi:hypothetical protein